ncbi:MAG: methionine--tRNA ligase [Candidatus Omnitrophica bacterium]|nr:methionine--tRNA ligase [Candidatus Omnitrophota bacterium]MBU1128407.1 methionine--tRNA ligase [Candidatus Omnitrophota bacterium]MBU1657238.1 methionine--tRNA ligase [Candidatus Omnitrophota bacterium]MBU1784745.1 methionine--tRNA ligase [Candidatus Omnitrophota bacterium]MBU1852287.1 methionine--tRNA ligase [Candidatus Omnitrophota bacterium]
MKKFYITTPIYYVNANPHIGHAYTQIAVDAVARYHKMLGDDVFFLTGTDEHGEKIEEACIAAGFGKGKEREFVDSIVVNFKKAWDVLDIAYDRFIRTTDDEHKKVVQEFMACLADNGDIYLGQYDGWFCAPCETFWTDTQAENGVCPDCGRATGRIKEENYFFKMNKYQKWLTDYINDNPGFIMPEYRKNEVLGFLREDLTDLCISRPRDRMSWGVPLPFDEDYVVYVWFDALINYLTGCNYAGGGKDFSECWPANFQVIAKDILRHHAVYWPIMLKSAGLAMPQVVFAHGWWKMGDEKMSKSKGNIVDPLDLVNKYGVDPIRYFLLRAVKFGQDGVYSEDALVTMYNNDLANDMGNLLNRTLTMVDKYFDGIAPTAPARAADNVLAALSGAIEENAKSIPSDVDMYFKDLRLNMVLERVWQLVGMANKYIEKSAPWKYSKEGNSPAVKTIIADLLEVLRIVAIFVFPFMPRTSMEMWKQLGLSDDVSRVSLKKLNTWRGFPAGTRIAKGEPLFPRISSAL